MGTALAVCAAKHAPVVLWSIELDVVGQINHKHENTSYLAGVRLPKNIRATGRLRDAVTNAQLVIISVPSHVVERVMRDVVPHLSRTTLILNVAKGVDERTLEPMITRIQKTLPASRRKNVATLSGPSIATEFAAGMPTVVNIASTERKTAERIAQLLETPFFRLRVTNDVLGTALGGTLKNIYALLLGMCDGAKLGANTKAALMTLAVEEMNMLMRALGAKSTDAVHGFAGLGDLFVTGTSSHSRNRRFGEEICVDAACRIKMKDPAQTIEGVKAVAALAPFARKKKLATPLLFLVDRVLFKNVSPKTAIHAALAKIH